MKNLKLFTLILVFVFTLTACQLFSSGSTPVATAPASTEAPASTAAGAIPYPEGNQLALPVISNDAYPTPDVGLQSTQMVIQDYPEPGATLPAAEAAQQSYPAPAAKPLVAQLEPVYPDLKDGSEVQWSQVQSIVFSGQVTKIGQTHDLNVYITLKDGRTFKVVEPAIDDILKLVQQCGDLCKDIKVATQ
jgi:hypothetical protein